MTIAHRLAPVVDLHPEGDGRTLEVMLAPWGTAATVDDGEGRYTETLARGSLVPTPDRVVGVYREHGGPLIGRLDGHWDREDGLYGNLRIADTSDGRDTLALLEERVVQGVSVEFELDDAPAHRGADVTRTGPLALTGVALVPYPAYQTATVLSARSETPTMSIIEETVSDVPDPQPAPEPEPDGDGPEAALEAQRRGVVLTSARRSEVTKVAARPRYESYGHFVQEQAQRWQRSEPLDDYIHTVNRALADEVTGDVPGLIHETWLSSIQGIINRGRVTANVFGVSPLPAGETIAWPQYVSGPAVGVQATQKTEVPSAKVIINKQHSDVVTYGGAQDVSLQTILRSDPSYVTQLMQLFALKLGEAVNTAAVGNLTTQSTTTPVNVPTAPVIDAATAHALLAAVASAAAQVMSNGGTPDVFVVGPALWGLFATSTDAAGRPLLPASAPANPMGTSTLSSMTGSWQGLTWVLDPTLTTPATAAGFVGDSSAFETYLSPIGNLSLDVPEKIGRDIGVYQFGSYAFLNPKQVVVLKGAIAPPFADEESSDSKKK